MRALLVDVLSVFACLLRRANGDPTIFFCDWHVIYRRVQKPFFISWCKNFWSLLIDNPFNDGFGAKISIFFFQLNEMKDEAKTWLLVSGPDVTSSFLKKIRVALKSRDSRW